MADATAPDASLKHQDAAADAADAVAAIDASAWPAALGADSCTVTVGGGSIVNVTRVLVWRHAVGEVDALTFGCAGAAEQGDVTFEGELAFSASPTVAPQWGQLDTSAGTSVDEGLAVTACNYAANGPSGFPVGSTVTITFECNPIGQTKVTGKLTATVTSQP